MNHARPSLIRGVKPLDHPDDEVLAPSSPNIRETTVKTDDTARVVFLGSEKVGKTSLIQRFMHNRFDTKYTPTVEDMHTKKYIFKKCLIPLILVDTSGSFDFPVMLRLWIAKANAFVIVFSHDNAESMTQAENLLAQIKMHRKGYAQLDVADNHAQSLPHQRPVQPLDLQADANDNQVDISCSKTLSHLVLTVPPIVVVCNKSDLPPSDSQVSENAIMDWLLKNELKPTQFVYASAKSNDSIDTIFKSLWDQNETSQTIQFGPLENTRHSSFICQRPSQTVTDFSALADTVHVNDSNNAVIAPDTTACTSSSATSVFAPRTRSGILRNSLRLTRGSSNKASKAKSDLVKLDCAVS